MEAHRRYERTRRRGRRDEAHAEYLASAEAYREGDGYAIPGEFVIATVRKVSVVAPG